MFTTRRQFLKYLVALGFFSTATRSTSMSFSSLLSERHMRVIPSSGEKVPAIGLGSWLTFAIDVDDAEELDKRAAILYTFLRLGGGVLDSSPMYGVAEKVIGIGLKRHADNKDLFSATKVWTTGDRAAFLQMSESFHLWGLKKMELMQVHNLVDWQRHLPTLYAMKQQGDIRYVGVTTSHGRRHDELSRIMRSQSLDFVQFTYNILDREAEQALLPLAKDRGIAVIINRPFQRGGLFDKFERYPLPDWAAEIDCENWAQFFLKFVISHPAVTCTIPATSQLVHLRENMAACYGVLPDESTRKKMVAYVRDL